MSNDETIRLKNFNNELSTTNIPVRKLNTDIGDSRTSPSSGRANNFKFGLAVDLRQSRMMTGG